FALAATSVKWVTGVSRSTNPASEPDGTTCSGDPPPTPVSWISTVVGFGRPPSETFQWSRSLPLPGRRVTEKPFTSGAESTGGTTSFAFQKIARWIVPAKLPTPLAAVLNRGSSGLFAAVSRAKPPALPVFSVLTL